MTETKQVCGMSVVWGPFNTYTPYYQFVVEMKKECPECDVNSWLNDSRASFAFDRGYNKGRLADEEHTRCLVEMLTREERKRKKLVELLKGKGIIVDASGDDVRILEYN